VSGEPEGDQDSEQQKPQPLDEAAEVVAGGGEHDIDGIAARVGEIVAAHAVVIFEMSDHRLDGGAALELALDLRGDATLLAGGVDFEAVLGRGVVAAIAGIGDDAIEHIADERLHVGNDVGERVPIVRVAGQCGYVRDELAAGGMLDGSGDTYLDTELVGPMRLALADAFDLGRMVTLRPR
jgi:hypothetical protein